MWYANLFAASKLKKKRFHRTNLSHIDIVKLSLNWLSQKKQKLFSWIQKSETERRKRSENAIHRKLLSWFVRQKEFYA